MYKAISIGVSVPAYNEEGLIIDTLAGMPDYVDRIYVCNDASTDGTREEVEEFMKKDHRVFLINHESNTGVGGAIIDCHKKALDEGMAIIAVMAGDNQMDPAYLPQLLDPLIAGRADYTKGNRLYKRDALHGMSAWRVLGNRMLTLLTKGVTGNWNISDPQNGYTAITAEAVRKLPLDSIYKGYLFENDMLIKLNGLDMRIMDIPIPARYGNEKSGINYTSFITKGTLFMIRGFFWRLKVKYLVRNAYSRALFYSLGIILMPFGVIMAAWVMFNNLLNDRPITGGLWAPLIVIALGISSIIFWTYLKRAHINAEVEGHDA